ncbi:MAG: AraC family transcriptional regulator, partial [Calditrichota bacterium]
MLGHAGWYSTQPYRDIMFYIPFQQVLFLGPLIYFYTQSLLDTSFRFRKKDLLHFVPGILYLIYSLIVLVTDKVILGEYYFYADE